MAIEDTQHTTPPQAANAITALAELYDVKHSDEGMLNGKYVRTYVDGNTYMTGEFTLSQLIMDAFLQLLEAIGISTGAKGITGDGKIDLQNKLVTDLDSANLANMIEVGSIERKTLVKATLALQELQGTTGTIFGELATILDTGVKRIIPVEEFNSILEGQDTPPNHDVMDAMLVEADAIGLSEERPSPAPSVYEVDAMLDADVPLVDAIQDAIVDVDLLAAELTRSIRAPSPTDSGAELTPDSTRSLSPTDSGNGDSLPGTPTPRGPTALEVPTPTPNIEEVIPTRPSPAPRGPRPSVKTMTKLLASNGCGNPRDHLRALLSYSENLDRARSAIDRNRDFVEKQTSELLDRLNKLKDSHGKTARSRTVHEYGLQKKLDALSEEVGRRTGNLDSLENLPKGPYFSKQRKEITALIAESESLLETAKTKKADLVQQIEELRATNEEILRLEIKEKEVNNILIDKLGVTAEQYFALDANVNVLTRVQTILEEREGLVSKLLKESYSYANSYRVESELFETALVDHMAKMTPFSRSLSRQLIEGAESLASKHNILHVE